MNNYSGLGCKQAKSSAWHHCVLRMYGTWRILWTDMAESLRRSHEGGHPPSSPGLLGRYSVIFSWNCFPIFDLVNHLAMSQPCCRFEAWVSCFCWSSRFGSSGKKAESRNSLQLWTSLSTSLLVTWYSETSAIILLLYGAFTRLLSSTFV